MTDSIEQWLEALELGRYNQAFKDAEISIRDLPLIQEADLVELGLPIGPRRRILQAVTQLDVTAVPAPPGKLEEHGSTEAERRQLTVMFVDLVGSTELSGRIDPEDLRSLMQRYQEAVAAVIKKNRGYVANWLGDGVLAYFGWPSAGEDQAELAVRAGLESTVAVSQLPLASDSTEMLAARVGIATGQVVVGDLEEGSVGPQGMVTGETPNLAARLQGVAQPGSVVIGRTTQSLVRASFALDFMGPQDLKGFDAPVDAWAVRSEHERTTRFEAPGRQLTAFTGRTHEVGLLLDRWSEAQAGEGQIALISGEPGIGKSRIVRAFRDRIEGNAHRLLLYQCSPHHINSALYPAIRQIEHAAGIAQGEAAGAKLAKLEKLLRMATPDIDEVAPLIAALLSIPFDERYDALEIPASQQRIATLRALQEQLFALAQKEPVLFVLEDAHWIDPTTLELVSAIVPRLAAQRVMVLITHRPEWQDPFHGHGHVARINMTKLSRTQIAEMARDVAGNALPQSTIARIIERTDGVPLFVEELTKAMAEAGYELAEADVPVTLQASLMARLDRLGSAKEIAQIGAVIGREFGRELLQCVTERNEADLSASLDRLVDAQLIFRTVHAEGGEIFTFKHALIQDVAYESLLRQRRRALHLAIAQALCGDDNSGVAPEILAKHFELGDNLGKALLWSERAGIAASERSAQPEAVAHISSALRILRSIGRPDDDGSMELSLLLRLGQAQFGAVGGGAPDTIATFDRASVLAERLGDSTAQVVAHYGRYVGHVLTGKLRQANQTAVQVAGIAEQTGNVWMDVVAARLAAGALYLMGDLQAARAELERSIAHGDRVARAVPPGFAHNPVATTPPILAHVEWSAGNREKAFEIIDNGIEHLVRKNEDANSLAFALTWAVLLGTYDRNRDRVQSAAGQLLEHTKRTGGVFWEQISNWGLGTAELWAGNLEGLVLVNAGIDGFVATGGLQHVPFMKLSLAEGHYLSGDTAQALATLEEVRDLIEHTGQHFYEPEMHRLRGIVLEKVGRAEEASSAYMAAVAVADKQGSISWRDRAAKNLEELKTEE